MSANALYKVSRRPHGIPLYYALCAACLFVGFATPSVIAGERADMLDVYGSEQAISIATGYDKPIVRAPAVATVITADKIKEIGATTVDEVLETVAGFHLSTPDAFSTVPVIRGISSRLLILLNNVPVAQGLFVNAFGELNNVPINHIERIEVIRGPGSAVYGADALSGVINIVTKTAEDINGTEVGTRAGSFDTYDGWFLHGGHYGGIDVTLSASGRTTNGYDEIIAADAQTRFDALLGTRASLAPSSINTQKDVIDVRADVSRGPWTLRAGYFGQLNVGTGIGISRSLDPDGEGNIELVNSDLTYHDRYSEILDITAQLSYVNVNSIFDLTAFRPGHSGALSPRACVRTWSLTKTGPRGTHGSIHRVPAPLGEGGIGRRIRVHGYDAGRRNYTVRQSVRSSDRTVRRSRRYQRCSALPG